MKYNYINCKFASSNDVCVMAKYKMEKQKKGKNYKDTVKKDNVRSSLVQHNLFKADSSSFKSARDFTRRLLLKIKRHSNNDNNTFAITPVNWM